MSNIPKSVSMAMTAYHAYGEAVDFKNYQGLPMPAWEALTPAIQAAWICAATALASELQYTSSGGCGSGCGCSG